jgi:uncharacterized protein (DUF2132 family)
MITWAEELNSAKLDTNSNNYNESQNRPPLFICYSSPSLELSLKFLESTPWSSSPWRNQVLPNDGACNEDSDDSAIG